MITTIIIIEGTINPAYQYYG